MKNRKKFSSYIVVLNVIFIIASLHIYKFIEGSYNLAMIIILIFYAILNGLSIFLLFWHEEKMIESELPYYQFGKIPNQNYLKTLDCSHFKGNSFLLASIVLANHEELIKAFDEVFFYKVMSEIHDRIKKQINHKTITISNNIRKIMLIVETDQFKEVLDIITSLLEEEVLMESIPIQLEYNIGYYISDNIDNLQDRNLFLECDIASKYAVNNNIKTVCYNDIEETYQYDYNLLKLIPRAIENKELFFTINQLFLLKKKNLFFWKC